MPRHCVLYLACRASICKNINGVRVWTRGFDFVKGLEKAIHFVLDSWLFERGLESDLRCQCDDCNGSSETLEK